MCIIWIFNNCLTALNQCLCSITHYFSHFNRGYISKTPSFIVAAVIFRERRERARVSEWKKSTSHPCQMSFPIHCPHPHPPPSPNSLSFSSNMLSHFRHQNMYLWEVNDRPSGGSSRRAADGKKHSKNTTLIQRWTNVDSTSCIGVGRGGSPPPPPPIMLEGGGGNILFAPPPPNNSSTFSFNVYVKQLTLDPKSTNLIYVPFILSEGISKSIHVPINSNINFAILSVFCNYLALVGGGDSDQFIASEKFAPLPPPPPPPQ